jgi:hypothetical protein
MIQSTIPVTAMIIMQLKEEEDHHHAEKTAMVILLRCASTLCAPTSGYDDGYDRDDDVGFLARFISA